MEKTAILLLAHGSRASDANQALYQIAREIEATNQYASVECAFLEMNQPDIPTGLTLCHEAGATHIVIVPYFLHLGRHVREDLPRLISQWSASQPGVRVTVGSSLGYSPKLVALVQERIAQALQD